MLRHLPGIGQLRRTCELTKSETPAERAPRSITRSNDTGGFFIGDFPDWSVVAAREHANLLKRGG